MRTVIFIGVLLSFVSASVLAAPVDSETDHSLCEF